MALSQGLTEDYAPVVAAMIERGDKVVENYTVESSSLAGNELSRLYFDIFEGSGMEFTLGLKNQSFMLGIESKFSLLTSECMRGSDKKVVQKSWDELKAELTVAVEKYSSGDALPSFWGKVFQSFLILLREGVEAMLVVAALVAYLRRSGYADKVRVIWHGVVWALVASVAAAWLINALFKASGAGREALEGITMLVAAALLIYVSYWLFAKREAERWQAFIEGQMDRALSRGSLFALGSISFLAVFREGAETILFYQALIGGSAGQLQAIWVGMGLAAVALVVVYLVVRLASIRLPLGLFFGGTAALLYGMAFVFAGQGIMELQVAGKIPATGLEGWPMISWLGIFPVRETMLAQAVVLLFLPLGWLFVTLKKRSQTQPLGEQN